MDYKLTEHAKKRCISRKIQIEWIQRALDHPVRIETDAEDANLAHALWPIPEKGFRVLRVIYNENVTHCYSGYRLFRE